jgi:1,6-anhydro-N-acetylmuramate kinase
MSGTSLDGVDGVLAELDDDSGRPLRVLAHATAPLPKSWRRTAGPERSPAPTNCTAPRWPPTP